MDEKKIELSHVEQLEQGLATERARRVDAKVESGQAVRAPITVVSAGPDDAESVLVSVGADKVAELRQAGERREIIVEPFQIFTGVPRPWRDPRYFERLTRDLAQQTVEQRQRDEAEAAAKVEVFHEGTRSHEPQPDAPMPKAVDVTPPGDLERHGAVVQMSGPTNGGPGVVREGAYGVVEGPPRVIYIFDDQGNHITTRLLLDGEDAKTTAKSLLRDHYMKRHNSFYDPISYPEKSIY
jgi:hypothetical protein